MDPWVGEIAWRRESLPTPVFLGLPCGSAGKESACNAGDLDSTPGLLGRSLEKGKATLSGMLAWRILWPLWSMGLQRIRRDWATYSSLCVLQECFIFESFFFFRFFIYLVKFFPRYLILYSVVNVISSSIMSSECSLFVYIRPLD